jgi:hypothetical protein
MQDILEVIREVPYWEWALLAYIILIGMRACNNYVIALWKALTLPVGFLALAIIVFWKEETTWMVKTFIPIYIVLGMFIGYIMTRHIQIHVDKEKNLIAVPGTWIVLILSIMVFVLRYLFLILFNVDPAIKHKFFLQALHFYIPFTVAGIFSGRFIVLVKKFQEAEHVELKESLPFHFLHRKKRHDENPHQ